MNALSNCQSYIYYVKTLFFDITVIIYKSDNLVSLRDVSQNEEHYWEVVIAFFKVCLYA